MQKNVHLLQLLNCRVYIDHRGSIAEDTGGSFLFGLITKLPATAIIDKLHL